MTLHIHTIPMGPLDTNCYVLWPADGEANASGETPCWVVDVSMWSKPMVEFLRKNHLTPERALLTHGHGDHIGGLTYLREQFPQTKIYCPAADADMLQSPELNLSATFLMGIVAPDADELLQPGDEMDLAGLPCRVLDTSGHTLGGTSFYCPSEGVVFTGDSLFAGSIGRCDIPNGDHARLVRNIREQLLTLPDETRVFPGHGPETTIGREKTANPFLQ
ncbi:MAG: MBL fold metallo-hydrolase [Phycisphaerae bacterium]|nr:MBL fold metallo-hydrolase [Phycisphaerae bacterium]